MHLFKMEITAMDGMVCTMEIIQGQTYARLVYDIEERTLQYLDNNEVSRLLSNNEGQLRRLLHNKSEDSFHMGFSLQFALRENKDVMSFNDRSKIVVLDKRNGEEQIYVVDNGENEIHSIFIDGSYLEKYNRGGIAVLFMDPKGKQRLFTYPTESKSSSLIELEAVIKGMEILEGVKKVRIVTDSQYVRKGLTEWILNWRLNDWYTANGKKARNIECWRRFDQLTRGKYIEFQWVKSHSDHFENAICDLYAKKQAKGEM